jgi:hypothetical protein
MLFDMLIKAEVYGNCNLPSRNVKLLDGKNMEGVGV